MEGCGPVEVAFKSYSPPHPQNHSCLPDPSRQRDATGQTEPLLPCHDSCISSQVGPVRQCVKVTRESSGCDLPTSGALTGFTRQSSPEPTEGRNSILRSTEMFLPEKDKLLLARACTF